MDADAPSCEWQHCDFPANYAVDGTRVCDRHWELAERLRVIELAFKIGLGLGVFESLAGLGE